MLYEVITRPAGEFDTSYAYDMATIRQRWQWWLLVAFILVVGGLAGIGLGVWEWFQPAAFDGFVRDLRQQIRWPLFV